MDGECGPLVKLAARLAYEKQVVGVEDAPTWENLPENWREEWCNRAAEQLTEGDKEPPAPET